MKINSKVDDPRLVAPQCHSLIPVKTVHKNPWFSVRDRGGYYCVEYNQPQVAVLPIVDHRAVVMVRVKRPTLADATLELPAGGAKDDEIPIHTAAREFAEETGVNIADVTRFKQSPPLCITPRFPHLPYIFKIQISKGEYDNRKSHDDEIESVECLEFDAVIKKIVQGEIYIGLPIAFVSRFLFSNNGVLKLWNLI